MEAESEGGVSQRLRAQQLQPTRVKKKAKALDFQIGTGVGQKDIVTFTRLFATMIDAGLPIVQCLDILQGQTDNKYFAAILRDMKASVEQGATFSDALRRHPKVFDHLYVNLVQAGEVGGILDTILNRLAVYIEKSMKLRRQVRGAMAYPSIVIVVFFGVLTILLTFVIPGFETMFKDFGSKDDLPGLTKVVMAVSRAFVSNVLWVFLAIMGLIAGVTYVNRTPKGKRTIHRTLLRLPVLGPV